APIDLAPLADGGEGTLDAIAAADGWGWRSIMVSDPLGRPVTARWLLSADGRAAALEMAEASGLSLVAPDQRDPVASSTFGTGQLLAAAVEAGAERIVLGIGGSATTDGGRGAMLALGGRPNSDLPDAPWDLRGIPATLEGVALEVASDVSNP